MEVYEEENHQHEFLSKEGGLPSGGTLLFRQHRGLQRRVNFAVDS